MIQELFNAATWLVNWTWQLLNSNFLTALAGAFAGAYGAQWIIKRIERKRRHLEEIRSTNAAIMVAFGITNTFCALKDQHVKGLKDGFDRQRTALEAHQLQKNQGSIPPQQPFEFEANFQTLLPIHVPIEVLHKLLFEKISVAGRPLTLVATLSQSIDVLNNSHERRNEIIAKCQANSPLHPDVLASIYFGLPDRNGHIDRSYPDSVDAISNQTDDCIFFSKLLGEDLFEHGQQLAKSFGKHSPPIQKVDFTKAEQNGLIPDTKLYVDWLSMPKTSSLSK